MARQCKIILPSMFLLLLAAVGGVQLRSSNNTTGSSGRTPHKCEHTLNGDFDVCQPWGGTFELGQGTGPELVVVHLEKAAGTEVIGNLKQDARGRLHVVDEHSSLSESLMSKEYFRIGLIREPCDWYVSEYFWGFGGVKGKGWLRNHLNILGLDQRFYKGEGSREQFKEWLYFLAGVSSPSGKDPSMAQSPNERCGMMSMRIWLQNVNETAMKQINEANYDRQCGFMNAHDFHSSTGHCPCPLGNCAGVADAGFHRTCKQEIEPSALDKFDCWIRTDHGEADYRECMEKYIKRGGTVTVGPPRDKARLAKEHPSCEAMFDSETEELVNILDGGLRKAFGYSQCCKPHPSERMPISDGN